MRNLFKALGVGITVTYLCYVAYTASVKYKLTHRIQLHIAGTEKLVQCPDRYVDRFDNLAIGTYVYLDGVIPVSGKITGINVFQRGDEVTKTYTIIFEEHPYFINEE